MFEMYIHLHNPVTVGNDIIVSEVEDESYEEILAKRISKKLNRNSVKNINDQDQVLLENYLYLIWIDDFLHPSFQNDPRFYSHKKNRNWSFPTNS